MPKLPEENQFLDLSDYGRSLGNFIARSLKDTVATPIHITLAFIIMGLMAMFCILKHLYLAAAILLILKSILDAADGELARIRNKPSYTGRYFDSNADIILNFFIILSIWHVTQGDIFHALLAFFCMQLQGTLYNFYYVILRNMVHGDETSQVFETKVPIAMEWESQRSVDVLYRLYILLYGGFDRIIYMFDKTAVQSRLLPRWFMTSVSIFGLGFQLLIIGIMLVIDLGQQIIPLFIALTALIPVFIIIRKIINRPLL
ncbi:MAG: CDP-alcohol phosphatidyltransferase family protein [Saprospiraceae bacterium]|nr:CDP-alcohol phosphatidyltransferase family protein [Saprospiraceae bacterium]